MDSESVDQDEATETQRRDEVTIETKDNHEPSQENKTYKDTEYAIGGNNKIDATDANKYPNPPPQYDMTFDERDRYPVYLRHTDDQCIQQQQCGRGFYGHVTERNKPQASRIRMNLEPASVSAETQTCGKDELVRWEYVGKQPWIQQFGGQPYNMRRCDGSMLSHPMRDWR